MAARALPAALVLLLTACAAPDRRPEARAAPGAPAPRQGDEIVVAGRFFHTGTPVVLWFEPPNYDAYRTDKRFAHPGEAAWSPDAGPATPYRYSTRRMPGDPNDLGDLRAHVDQLVVHYDAAGSSRQCFKILHDVRGLSCHFLLDVDGTIYQTMDLKERAWHATIANDRSIGIEIAHIGAYPIAQTTGEPVTPDMIEASPKGAYYDHDARGPYLTLPAWQGGGGLPPGFLESRPRPARPFPVVGEIHGRPLTQYDFTDAQYEALARLTAALAEVFPAIALDCPRDGAGRPLARALTPEEFASFRGVLGHFHIQAGKIDPGPAFDWDRFLEQARAARP